MNLLLFLLKKFKKVTIILLSWIGLLYSRLCFRLAKHSLWNIISYYGLNYNFASVQQKGTGFIKCPKSAEFQFKLDRLKDGIDNSSLCKVPNVELKYKKTKSDFQENVNFKRLPRYALGICCVI